MQGNRTKLFCGSSLLAHSTHNLESHNTRPCSLSVSALCSFPLLASILSPAPGKVFDGRAWVPGARICREALLPAICVLLGGIEPWSPNKAPPGHCCTFSSKLSIDTGQWKQLFRTDAWGSVQIVLRDGSSGNKVGADLQVKSYLGKSCRDSAF